MSAADLRAAADYAERAYAYAFAERHMAWHVARDAGRHAVSDAACAAGRARVRRACENAAAAADVAAEAWRACVDVYEAAAVVAP